MYYVCVVKVETEKLLTVKNYALKWKVSPSYLYRLIREKRMSAVIIDGIQFIDLGKFPSFPKEE